MEMSMAKVAYLEDSLSVLIRKIDAEPQDIFGLYVAYVRKASKLACNI